MNGPFLWVALDGLTANEEATLDLARELNRAPGNFGWKVNLDWALKVGYSGLRQKPLDERPVFADLKMWNGARTMADVFWQMHMAGVTATNAYALAGAYTYGIATGRSKDDQLKQAISVFRARGGDTKLLRIYAVTILTHYSENYVQSNWDCSLGAFVRQKAIEGFDAGADGVIMPGTQISAVEDLPTTKVLPGIRPTWYKDDRHEQETTPESVARRTDVEVVCGSPIVKGTDPLENLKRVLSALQA